MGKPQPKEIEIDLVNGDVTATKDLKDRAHEYIMIAGKWTRIHQYKNISPPNELEVPNVLEVTKADNERVCREAEEFMARSMDTPGHTYSGDVKIPYDVIETQEGGTIIRPATFQNGKRLPIT
jgi:hypothetical protein